MPTSPPRALSLLGRLRASILRNARERSATVAAIALAAVLIASARAGADPTILHEFIPPDPGEDVTFAATTLEGDLPAAIQTPSGLATAPDPRRSPVADHVYGGATTDDGPDSTYEPDRDTRRPNVENYDDPFTPATAPFKRLRAYDWVDADYSLRVRDKSLRALPVGGSAGNGDEPFYGDLSVDLIPGQPVRIPTVGPGARILRMHVNPEVPVEVLRDGADNWFVRGAGAAARAAGGGARDPARHVRPRVRRRRLGRARRDRGAPRASTRGRGSHEAAVDEVAQAIGISRAAAAARGGAQDGRLLPRLRALGRAADRARGHLPRPRPVEEGRVPAPRRSRSS